MALLISHRGNKNGMNIEKENNPEYVQEVLNEGYQVMVNTWLIGKNHLALGSESAKYPVELKFLQNPNIICKAENVKTLVYLMENRVHCFIHDRDDYTQTNGGLIWTMPGKKLTEKSILFKPEHIFEDISSMALLTCAGICSDRIEIIRLSREELEKKLENERKEKK